MPTKSQLSPQRQQGRMGISSSINEKENNNNIDFSSNASSSSQQQQQIDNLISRLNKLEQTTQSHLSHSTEQRVASLEEMVSSLRKTVTIFIYLFFLITYLYLYIVKI